MLLRSSWLLLSGLIEPRVNSTHWSGCLALNAAWVWLYCFVFALYRTYCTSLQEGHYGFKKELLAAFFFFFLACNSFGVHVSVVFQRHEDVQMFSSIYFEIMTWETRGGNYLNVFIVFYWNKWFRLFLPCEKYILPFDTFEILQETNRLCSDSVKTHGTDLRITEQLQQRGYSNYPRSNQLHWSSVNWCNL